MLSVEGLTFRHVVILALITSPARQQDGVDFPTFLRQKVQESFDKRLPFDANLFEILAILCPESVYCSGGEGTENGAQKHWSTEYFRDLYGQSRREDTSSAALHAREAVKQNRFRLDGCCEKCSCHKNCQEQNNCCPAIARERTEPPTVRQECIEASVKSADTSPARIPFYGFSYYMVSDCFCDEPPQETINRCQQPNVTLVDEASPVYSPQSQRIYRNRFCADCNGDVFGVIPLDLIISFSYESTAKVILGKSGVELYPWVIKNPRLAKNLFVIPGRLVSNETDYMCILDSHLYQMPEITLIDETDFFNRACLETDVRFYTVMRMYRNVFCYILTVVKYSTVMGDCSENTRKTFGQMFTGILNVNQAEQHKPRETKQQRKEPCYCNEIFDNRNDTCRELLCPFGQRYVGCDCVPRLTMISGLGILVYTDITPSPLGNDEPLSRYRRFAVAVAKKLEQIMCDGCGSVSTVALIRETSSTDPRHITLTAVSVIRVTFGFDTLSSVKNIWQNLKQSVSFAYLQQKMTMTPGLHHIVQYNELVGELELDPDPALQSDLSVRIVYSVESYRPTTSSNIPILSDLLFCSSITLNEDEIASLTNTSTAAGYTQKHLRQSYDNQDARMCIDDFINVFTNSSDKPGLVYTIILLYTCLTTSLRKIAVIIM